MCDDQKLRDRAGYHDVSASISRSGNARASIASVGLLAAAAAVVAPLVTLPAAAADSAVVLLYHRFGEDAYPSTNIRVGQFESQLEYLADEGFVVVSLADVIAAVEDNDPLPDRAVAITVDDAYLSVYAVAWPMLASRDLPFTVFVSTDPVDQSLPGYMSWDQMREMQAAGVSFANHGASHDSLLTGGDEDEADRLARVRADIEKARSRLEEELDPIPGVFAYPYGEYDSATGELLLGMGYLGFGQQSGALGPLSDRRALPRFPMSEAFGGMDQYPTKVSSLPLPVEEVEPWEPVTGQRLPVIEITLRQDNDVRYAQLACFVGGQGRVDIDWIVPDVRFSVAPREPLADGRQRINCTAPSSAGRYYWFSHQWVIR